MVLFLNVCLHFLIFLPFCSPAVPQNSDVESFQCKLTSLSSTTLEKLRHVLDHRCIVGGGEQIFLLALGVSLSHQNVVLQLVSHR